MKHADQIFIAFATPKKCHQTLLIAAGGQEKKVVFMVELLTERCYDEC